MHAVQYGHDTDTTAAIAGGLAGLHFGADSIPIDWLSGLRGRAVVDPLLDRLLHRLDRVPRAIAARDGTRTSPIR